MKKVKLTLKSGIYGPTSMTKECEEYRYNNKFLELSPTGKFGPGNKIFMVPIKNILYMEEI